MIIIYEFFAQHPETAENLARFIFGMGGGYVAWAWIWKIQDGENDPAEKADRFELSNRMVVGGILGIMFGEMLSVMAGLNISGVPMTFLNEFTWVIAGFVGILGKSFVKKFLSMLASDVFDLHEKNKNKMLAGELSVSQVEKTKQSPVATTMPVAESKTEEVVKVASVVTAPVEEVKTEVGMTAPTNAVTEKLRGHIPDHVLRSERSVMVYLS